jgi:seryl-tRNA synthetase
MLFKKTFKKRQNFRKKNKTNKRGGGVWELLGFQTDSEAIKELKLEKTKCETTAKTKENEHIEAIKQAKEAIKQAELNIEEIRKSKNTCKTKIDTDITAQQLKEKSQKYQIESEKLKKASVPTVPNPLQQQSSSTYGNDKPSPVYDEYDNDTQPQMQQPQMQRYAAAGGRSKLARKRTKNQKKNK